MKLENKIVEQISTSPEIWKIHVPLPNNPLKNLNSYVVRSGGEALVIDTGFNRPECEQALREGLEELGLAFDKAKLFLTHLHADHTGLAQLFADAGCQIYMGKTDHVFLERFNTGETWSARESLLEKEGFPKEELEQQYSKNQAVIFSAKESFPIIGMSDQSAFSLGNLQLRCVETPGHTPGHMCLYMPEEEIMFLGDHILFDITPNIGIWPGVTTSLRDYLNSLEVVRQVPMKLALPAHRAGQMDVYKRIESLKEHHKNRLQNTLDVIEKEPDLTAYEIASRMQWSMRGKQWDEFPVNQKWFAVGETIAHLDYLMEAGDIQKSQQSGFYRYQIS